MYSYLPYFTFPASSCWSSLGCQESKTWLFIIVKLCMKAATNRPTEIEMVYVVAHTELHIISQFYQFMFLEKPQ